MRSSPLFWLLDVEAPGYHVGFIRDGDLRGKVLMISSQLWSIIRGEQVYSILIGPGVFRGLATSGTRRLEVVEQLSSLIFDPTELRLEEPVPLVDIIHPEILDPLEKRRVEEIITLINKVMVERGNVLSGDTILRFRPQGTIQTTAHRLDVLQKITVSHVSGIQRAKFLLAGTNGPLYRPLVEGYQKRRYARPDLCKVMAVPFRRFCNFNDTEVMKDWMIVEKAAFETKTGVDAIQEEYSLTLDDVEKNSSAFIYTDS